MAQLDFPGSPSNGQIFTPVAGGPSWQWDGSKWVAATTASTAYAPITDPVFLGNPQAPQPAAGDADASIATTAFVTNAVATSLHDVGRNYLHNSTFRIAQRGNISVSATGYTAMDRWYLFAASDTSTVIWDAYNSGQIPIIGDEDFSTCLRCTFTGNAAAGAQTIVLQRIEGVRRLAGKTVTVSFWAHAGAAGVKLGVSFDQSPGTGGSPSGGGSYAGQAVTLTTSPVRYSLTFTLPSMASAVLGTNSNDFTGLDFWFSSGATNNTRAGGIGVQSGIVVIGGVQLELGPTATPLEKLDPVTQLQQCQRFYCTSTAYIAYNATTVAGAIGGTVYFPVTMRAFPPTVTFVSTGNTQVGAVTIQNQSPSTALYFAAITGTGQAQIQGTVTASADL